MSDEGDRIMRLTEVCESYGLPVSVDALVHHLINNTAMTKYLEAVNDQAAKLQHVGWWHPERRSFTHRDAGQAPPGAVAVFTHDDWLTMAPVTDRNRRPR